MAKTKGDESVNTNSGNAEATIVEGFKSMEVSVSKRFDCVSIVMGLPERAIEEVYETLKQIEEDCRLFSEIDPQSWDNTPKKGSFPVIVTGTVIEPVYPVPPDED